jgi:hypothetical protein
MTRERQLELTKELNDKLVNLFISKGTDYADADVLSNFKIVSQVVDLLKIDTKTPTGYALLMVVLKLCRIGNLLEKNATPQNESLLDSFGDGINYFKLAYLCEKDEEDARTINTVANQ